MLAQLTNVSLSFPDKKVLEKVSLTIYPGDRLALVGANGAGKTSILRMIAGRLEPDAGTVSRAEGIRIGHLERGPAGPEDEAGLTCMEAALAPFAAQIRLEERIERLAAELGGGDAPGLLEELGQAQQRFETAGGYTFRARTEATLTGLGLAEDLWDRRLSELSAGQRVRRALAKVLLEEHGLVLFDEPTNHLDIETQDVLLEALDGFPGGVLFVSHERHFVDELATGTLRLGIT